MANAWLVHAGDGHTLERVRQGTPDASDRAPITPGNLVPALLRCSITLYPGPNGGQMSPSPRFCRTCSRSRRTSCARCRYGILPGLCRYDTVALASLRRALPVSWPCVLADIFKPSRTALCWVPSPIPCRGKPGGRVCLRPEPSRGASRPAAAGGRRKGRALGRNHAQTTLGVETGGARIEHHVVWRTMREDDGHADW